MSNKLGTALLNFDPKVKVEGDQTGNKMFIVTFMCIDQDGDPSAYSLIYRGFSSKLCRDMATKDHCGVDVFGNKTRIEDVVEVGKMR